MTTKLEREAAIAKIDQLTEKRQMKRKTLEIYKSDNTGIREALYIDIELIDRCIVTLKDWIINDKMEY